MIWEAIERDYTIEQFEAELKKVENKTVKYGGKIHGNDCKLSVNY